ncbi:MAG: D-alanyl-D-alanine carboxypeptidase [Oscillospiraceae bacterium]|nr:D-alanyl-D-alanine carboxypeptidase [Oscillospiraceae bacterium]
MKRAVGLVLALVLILGALPLGANAVELEVAGKGVCLMDIATGTVLYEKNSHERLSPASVTKVMTLLLIMEAIGDGRIGWNDSVTASESAAAKGGSQIYLKVGETMTVETLVKSIAVSSANDAACAMAEHLAGSESAFVDMMNTRAKELGMNDTHFVNCTGLDDAEEAKEHLTSAYDIAVMSRELMKNHPDIQRFTTIWMDTIRDGAFGLANTNKMVRFYTGCTGLKTGYTSGAGFCLSATAEREGLGLIAVVLGCDTSQDRFAACKAMLDYGFASFALISPEPETRLTVPVKLGTGAAVAAVPGKAVELLIDKAQRGRVTTEVALEESVTAPVSQGQRLGTLTVKCADRILAQIPLVAETAVARLTFGDLFLMVLGRVVMAGA